MGKTIQIIALLHQNRKFAEPERETTGSRRRPKQLKLTSNPRVSTKKSSRRTPATLIVAPTSLLNQWEAEIKRSSKKGTLRSLVWHGQTRQDLNAVIPMETTDSDLEDPDLVDVVITSYGVLSSEWSKQYKGKTGYESPLYTGKFFALSSENSRESGAYDITVEWLRIVLDEAHHCKSRTSITSKAVCALQAAYRWAVTGAFARTAHRYKY
jgi:DNA repair protein RAD5